MERALADEQPRRLHWSSMLSGLGKSLRGMWGLFAGGAYLAASGNWLWIAPAVAAVLLASLVATVVRWRTFRYTVDGDEIRIDSGLLSKSHRSIPFDRIQDVDIAQGPIARALGVARVKLETGSAGKANADDGVLGAVELGEAEVLRQLVRARRSGVPVATADVTVETPEESRPVFAMDMKRLLLSGVFNFSLALFAGLAGASQTFGDVIGIDPFERSFWRQMETAVGPFASVILAHKAAAALAGATTLVLLGLATGLVRTVLRDFGFRVERNAAGLRRRRGLLTKTDVTLQVRRVQAAKIVTGPVKAAFGWSALKLQSLAQDDGGKDDHVVAPLASDAEVDALLGEIGSPPIADVTGWQPVSLSYVWGFLIGTAPLYLVAVGQALISPLLGIGFGLVVLLLQAERWLAWRRTEYVRDGQRILVRRGWWRRRLLILPTRNIQSIQLSESFISRWFGTAALTFGVAGGTGHSITAIPRENARKLRGELLQSAA